MTYKLLELLEKLTKIVAEGRGQEGQQLIDLYKSIELDFIYRDMDEN